MPGNNFIENAPYTIWQFSQQKNLWLEVFMSRV
jgi:hypothetical protein